jgi:hypothetical protein
MTAYHDGKTFTPSQAQRECDKCPGPCSTSCRWFMATHTASQRSLAMIDAAEFDMVAAIRAEFDSPVGRGHGAHHGKADWEYLRRLPRGKEDAA